MDNGIKFEKSNKKNKKYKATTPDGKVVHFGDKRYQHYQDKTPLGLYGHLNHGDEVRRKKYKARHEKILLKDGTPAYQKKYTPSWFSYKYLW
jgi:mRNA degradation ribonuclease J1/J2